MVTLDKYDESEMRRCLKDATGASSVDPVNLIRSVTRSTDAKERLIFFLCFLLLPILNPIRTKPKSPGLRCQILAQRSVEVGELVRVSRECQMIWKTGERSQVPGAKLNR